MTAAVKVAVIGTGLVGSGWAVVFARAGCDVALYDSVPGAAERGREVVAQQLRDLAAHGLIAEAPEAVLGRVSVARDLADALSGAAYAQESTFERLDVKREVFSAIDAAIGPDTLVGSSSSGIPASAYTDHVACRSRCLVAHPVNPPSLAPVVELVPAPWTAPETVRSVRALMEQVGQSPVEMTREIEGFILNRLQGVLLMEAWRLVEEGYATAEDVDRTVKDGLGLRWAFMGPFETIDLNAPGGVADYARRLGPLYRSIAASTAEHKVWDDAVIGTVEAQRRAVLPADGLAERRAWRDRRLMALAAHKKDAEA
ncbi:3-hydroxyacyl-CoA dehydrogenase [Roseomonas haemaphysalidis]|uniref:3-hydroxyacyl-CoA dehydrogenase n=1 Tax=Roseomonas haemaphysalidis TaxID=2768162 RepID=A0ABS3KPL5_9PROT|nr:3-hydroxyacyl-CoA dehydrogenase [Roseomonas haemaphysalidis]MBO1078543.1 3-hydroxyacyl-CoA dehydrogenase [Roseomonas haemaphysalidis]